MSRVGLLSAAIRRQLHNGSSGSRILKNFGWLAFDKAFRLGIGLVVGVWLARYLGPQDYGLLNYSIAFAAIFSGIATLGLDGIVVRELVRTPEKRDSILGSAFVLRLAAGLIALGLACAGVATMRPNEETAFWLVAIAATGAIFQSLNVIDFYFQSQVASRYTVYATNAAFTLMAILKVYLIATKATLLAFALAGLGEIALTAILLVATFQYNRLSVIDWKCSLRVTKELLHDGWPLLLAGMAVMVYMRVDTIMLQSMKSDTEVGIYSAATKLSEIWYFLPTIVISSFSPAIITAHKQDRGLFLKRLRLLYSGLFWLAVLISLPLSLASGWIITALYGPDYAASGPVLAVHLWAGVAVFLGVASSQYLIIEGLQTISLYRTAIGLVVNIALNIVLIPSLGALGAAIATVVSYFVATFSLCIFRETKSHTVFMAAAPFSIK